MADPRDELTLADMANEPGLLPPREPLRIRVSPYDAPPSSDTGWGGFGPGGRPSGRLFEPDTSTSPTETSFQQGIRATPWFSEFKAKFGEEPNLDDPNYDYRKAWAAGARPDVRDPGDNLLHWSSEFKGENHPNRFVNGVDTITGQPVQPQKTPFQPGILSAVPIVRGIGSLVQGVRDAWSGPSPTPQPSGQPPTMPPPVDPTAGPRQMWQQGYPSAPYKSMFEGPATTALEASGVPAFIESGKGYFNPETQPGEQQQRARQQVQTGANVTANLVGINAPVSAARSGATAGLFGGRLSPAADQKAFDLAERMQQRGASEGHIRNVTGLTLFPDKKFRFEVSDKDAYYKGIPNAYDPEKVAKSIFLQTNPNAEAKDFGTSLYRLSTLAARQVAEQRIASLPPLKWSDLMHHPEAEKAFPYLKGMPVEIDHTMHGLGAYGPPNKRGQGTGVFKLRPTDNDPRGQTFKVLLHEPMHKIQDVERFALGGNPDFIPLNSPAYKIYQDKLAQLRAQNISISPEAEQAAYSAAGREHYRRLAGENEANVVMDRMDLSPEQAAAINPVSQMRVRPKDQIVDFGDPEQLPLLMTSSPTLRGKAAEEAWRGTEKDPKLRTSTHPYGNVGGTPIREMESPIIKGAPKATPRLLDVEKDLSNAEFIFTGGDRTGAGGKLYGSKSIPFEEPVSRHGGPGYAQIMEKKKIEGAPGASPVWATMKAPMGEIFNIASDVERRGKVPWQVYMTGGGQYLDSSLQMVNTAVQAARTKGVSERANEYLYNVMHSPWNTAPDPKRPFPVTGLNNEKALREWIDNSPQPQRAKLVKAMDSVTARSLGFPDMGQLRVWNTDARMLTALPGSAGLSLARLEPSLGPIASHHPSYATGIAGRDVGTLGMQVPHQIIAPTMHESRMATLNKPQYYTAAPHLYFPGGGTHATKTEPVTNKLKDILQRWMLDNPGGLAVAGTAGAGGMGSLVAPNRQEVY